MVPIIDYMNPLGIFRFFSTVYRHGRNDRKQFGVGFLTQAKEVLALRRLNGLEPYEYFTYHLTNPSLTWDDKAAYLSYNQVCALHRELSPMQDRAITAKFITDRFFSWFGIAMPHNYGIYDPRFGRTAEGKPLTGFDEFRELVTSLPKDKFILKPAASAKGTGITAIVGREDSLFVSASGERLTAEQLFEKCLWGWKTTYSRTPQGLLVQEFIEQHELLQRIQPHSLNTLRVITFMNDEDRVEVLTTMIKFGLGTSMVDNISRGGMAARVDNGVIQDAYMEDSGDYQPVQKHPDTNGQITGIRLPYFDEAVALAVRGQQHIPQLRTLGWDIAITPTGPIIIEVNVFWGNVTQAVTRKGMITPGLRQVLDRIKW